MKCNESIEISRQCQTSLLQLGALIRKKYCREKKIDSTIKNSINLNDSQRDAVSTYIQATIYKHGKTGFTFNQFK